MTRLGYLFVIISFIFLISGCGNPPTSNEVSDLLFSCNTSTNQEGTDPLSSLQWHLNNNGEDINLKDVIYTGRGVLVSIVDDGLEIEHEDLKANIYQGNSYNYLDGSGTTTKGEHGTAIAGLIAAVNNNGLGGRGVAPCSKLVSFNVLKFATMENYADSLTRLKDKVSVSSNSWGDFNSWGVPLNLRSLVKNALIDGVTNGRQGKGINYIFSAGNGGEIKEGLPVDTVNLSGIVNNRYTIPVCAVDDKGKHPVYSEMGATLIVCAPSNGVGTGTKGLTTTDIMGEEGYNSKVFIDDIENRNYTRNFGGTSASAPIVSGVVALMLEANHSLSWRDVRIILSKSARKNDPTDSDWIINGAGYNINHKYGFGVVDDYKATTISKDWNNVEEESIIEKELVVNLAIPDNDLSGISSEIIIQEDIFIEFIEVVFDAGDHSYIGDLEIILTSPFGTESILAEQHYQRFSYFLYSNWQFGSMRHLGEKSKGTWKLTVRDKNKNNIGTFKSWKLKIFGTTRMV